MIRFHINIIEKKIIVLIFAIIVSLFKSQIVKYHYDKEMIFLSDADNESGKLSARQFEEFQLIANQLNLMMRLSAAH